MKSKSLHKYIKVVIITFLIFIIGIYSYINYLTCSISFIQSLLCNLARYTSYLFAPEIHIGLLINNLLSLPFNEFNVFIILIHLIYSYVLAYLILYAFKKLKKAPFPKVIKFKNK